MSGQVRFMSRFVLVTVLLLSYVMCPGDEGHCQEREEWQPDYIFWGGYDFSAQDSVKIRRVASWAMDWRLGQSDFFYGLYLSTFTGVHLRGRKSSYRLASTFPVFCGLMAVPALTARALGADDSTAYTIMKIAVAPFSPRLVYRPSPYFDVYVGYRPEFVLFTDNDGVLMELDAGIRITLVQPFVFTIEASRFSYWGIDQRGRDFGWGIGLGFSIGGGPTKQILDDKEDTK